MKLNRGVRGVRFILCSVAFRAHLLAAQEAAVVSNWTAPPYWTPPSRAIEPGPGDGRAEPTAQGILALPSGPLPFVAIPPCRLADTRDAAFPAGYGPPMLAAAVPRDFTFTGRCGIPGSAQAISSNLTVTGTLGPGFVVVFPAGGSPPSPLVSAINYERVGHTVGNAAVIPLGAGGAATFQPGVSGTHIIIDVNGYYTPLGAVTSLNTLQGDVMLVPGTNISITPGPQTLTITNTGGGGGGLPVGTNGQTLRNSGGIWAADSFLTNTGSAIGIGTASPNEQLEITGNLMLPSTTATTGQIRMGSDALLHSLGFRNLFVGRAAGSLSTTGGSNVGVGYSALKDNLGGYENTAVGNAALSMNTGGINNTAVGSGSMANNTAGSSNTSVGSSSLHSHTLGEANVAVGSGAMATNTTASGETAIGFNALYQQSFDNSGAVWYPENTAVGYSALGSNKARTVTEGVGNTAVGARSMSLSSTGIYNTAVGRWSLSSNTTGSWNVALGGDALRSNLAGHGNVAIGHRAGENETGSNRLHIGNGIGTLIYGEFDNQRVAIAATDPAAALDVNGYIRTRVLANGTVCSNPIGILFTCGVSDARLKTNVVRLSDEMDVLEALPRLRGVRFDWDPSVAKARAFGIRREVGVIAQEVEDVLPEVVSTAPDGYKSVDYSKLTAFLIEVSRAQQEQIRALQKQVDELRRRPAHPAAH